MIDRPVRRADRMLSVEDAQSVLKIADYGILSTVSSDGSPYGVPLSYVYINDTLYFHCAPEGPKLDNIIQHPEVCFCAVSQAETLADKFSVRYASATVFESRYFSFLVSLFHSWIGVIPHFGTSTPLDL